MKTFINIVCILIAGAIGGWIVRDIRSESKLRQTGPDADETVYTDDGTVVVDGRRVADPDAMIVESEPEAVPENETWVSEFRLIERSGDEISADDLIGTPYIVSFFFSTCPSICVRQNQMIQTLSQEYEGRNVKFLAISVDPDYDTPEVLREYATRFGAGDHWLFLTGPIDYVRHVGEEVFGQPVGKQAHSERFALVDAEGNIEGFYSWNNQLHLKRLRQRLDVMTSDDPDAF